jgi:hypothetical protein
MTTEVGVICGQVVTVEYLDAQLRPVAKADAVIVRLTFSNGELLIRRADLDLVDAAFLSPAGTSH